METDTPAVEAKTRAVRRGYLFWLHLLTAVSAAIVLGQWARLEVLQDRLNSQTIALHMAVGLSVHVATELSQERATVDAAIAQLAVLKREVVRIKLGEYVRIVTAKGHPCAQPHVDTERIVAAVLRAADLTGLEPELLLATLRIESCFNPRAVSPTGARGLAQIVRTTAAELGLPWERAFEIEPSVLHGAHYLRRQLDRAGNVHDALGRYNGWDDPHFPAKVLRVRAIVAASPTLKP